LQHNLRLVPELALPFVLLNHVVFPENANVNAVRLFLPQGLTLLERSLFCFCASLMKTQYFRNQPHEMDVSGAHEVNVGESSGRHQNEGIQLMEEEDSSTDEEEENNAGANQRWPAHLECTKETF
jgi:hypothetical protein